MLEEKIYKLENVIQDYAWGTKTALGELFGIENPYNKPQAEIWMGAHPKAPSIVLVNHSQKVPLIDFIQQDPRFVLGQEIAGRFGGKLPFLFKVLSASAPLSIQAHPGMEQAKAGFEKENRARIDISAPQRNYKDDNHKPELICAVTPFKALNGFRDIDEMLGLLEKLAIPAQKVALEKFRKNPNTEGLKEFYTWLMKLEKSEKDYFIDQAVSSALDKTDEPAFQELLDLHLYYSGDIGIMCPLLLNLIVLQPGEAMYLDAGVLHSYIHGTGMEIMANSDNVLRGGLTPKHVDVDELLTILSFHSGQLQIINPTAADIAGETKYVTPAGEFVLHVIDTTTTGSRLISNRERSVEILFCALGKGKIFITGNSEFLDLIPGESYLVPAGVSRYEIDGQVKLFKAAVPPN